jgi:hypothetical protein
MPPLALSNTELEILRSVAAPLQPAERAAFLKQVAIELASQPVLGDGVVHRVATQWRLRYWCPPEVEPPDEQ